MSHAPSSHAIPDGAQSSGVGPSCEPRGLAKSHSMAYPDFQFARQFV